MLKKPLNLALFLVVSLALATGAFALPEIDLGYDKSGEPIRPICGTEEIWQMRKAELGLTSYDKALCATEGLCDDPGVRDGTSIAGKTVRVVVHVIRGRRGEMPAGLTEQDVYDQIDQLNLDFGSYGVDFALQGVRYHNDRALTSISAYSYSGKYWTDILAIKDSYNESPDTQMNIYISGQDSGSLGVLLGIATFPWDPAATQARGGLWLNSQYVGLGQGTASHEMGHCLGLWHTHHGVSETDGCADDCSENAHARNDAAADYVGDFCKDTMPTPTNYYCSPPGGTDCNGVSWGATDVSNFMGYAPDSCYDHFSNEQTSRMHCWSSDRLSGLMDAGCTESAPSAASGLAATANGANQVDLTWSDNSSNEEGFRIERDSGGGFAQIGNTAAGVTSYSDSGLDCESSYSYRVVAYNCGGDASASGSSSATTGTCPVGPVAHVSDISLTTANKGPNYNGQGYVTVVDGGGSPVSGATVFATWSGTTSGSQSAVTASDGRAYFQSSKAKASSNCWTLSVDNITLSGGSYDAGANAVSSGQTGTACGGARILGDGAIVFVRQGAFNGSGADINFSINGQANVSLRVFDMRGALIRTLVDGASLGGSHAIHWDGADRNGQRVARGVYFYRLESGQDARSGKIVMVN